MKLHSRVYQREFEVELCPKNEGEQFNVVSHKSLQDIHDVELRGTLNTSLRVLKDSVTHAIVECQITDTASAFAVVEIGEKTKTADDTEIGKSFPVTTAYTRAFDRAMIRILGFEGKFYSDAEMPDNSRKNSSKACCEEMDIIPDIFTEDPIDSYTESEDKSETCDVPDENSINVEEEIADNVPDEPALIDDGFSETIPEEKNSDSDDPGSYKVVTGRKKGESLNDILAEDDGKGWLDYCLGSQYVKECDKMAIVKFYAAKGISVNEGDVDYLVAARKYYEDNAGSVGGKS